MSKVLVVDDEPGIRELVVEVLRDEGYATVAAENGRMALEVLAREGPDLVLMDVMMPGMDGRAAVREMRARPDLPRPPVILMSAAARPEHLEPGVAAFLPKPFDLGDLLDLVARWLNGAVGTTAGG